MGLGERLRRWIDRPTEPGPEDWVVVEVVPFHEGPLLQSALEGAGIPAVLQQWTDVAQHTRTQQNVAVRHRDVGRARELLADLRG